MSTAAVKLEAATKENIHFMWLAAMQQPDHNTIKSLHPNPTDTTTLPKHIEQYNTIYNQYSQSITADAGYGSEENFKYLEDNTIEGYVKYSSFDKQQSANHHKKNPSLQSNYITTNKEIAITARWARP